MFHLGYAQLLWMFFLSKLIWSFSCRYTRLQTPVIVQSVSIYLVPTYQTSWVPAEPPPVMHQSSRQTLWFKEQPLLEKGETYTGQYQQEKRRPESPFSHYSTEVHTRSGYSTAFSPVVVVGGSGLEVTGFLVLGGLNLGTSSSEGVFWQYQVPSPWRPWSLCNVATFPIREREPLVPWEAELECSPSLQKTGAPLM